jgi:hypothetical protein
MPIKVLRLSEEEFDSFVKAKPSSDYSKYIYARRGSRYESAEPFVKAGVALLRTPSGRQCPVTVSAGRCEDQKGYRTDYALIVSCRRMPIATGDAAKMTEATALATSLREASEARVESIKRDLAAAEATLTHRRKVEADCRLRIITADHPEKL